MLRGRVWGPLAVLFFLLSVVAVVGQGTPQPQVRVETIYPRHVARGQTTVINVAIPSRDTVQAAEISPSTGVTVAGIKGTSSESEQAIGWWEITLNVAKDASPGDRSLVLTMKMGPAAPATISVPTHVPTISDLKIVAPQPKQPTFEVLFAAADTARDLGDSPYVWFMADCGGEPIAGAVRGKVNAGAVRAVLPNLHQAGGGSAANATCDLQVRITDSTGIDSNTLRSAVAFTN
jgi:hypothetical protein